jgi:hypothetical protein
MNSKELFGFEGRCLGKRKDCKSVILSIWKRKISIPLKVIEVLFIGILN